MKEALELAVADPETRGMYFSTPYQIEIGMRSRPAPRSSPYQPQPQAAALAIQNAFGNGSKDKGAGKGKNKGKKGNKGNKGDKMQKRQSRCPSTKRIICFAFKKGEACDGTCGMLHICQLCLGGHPMCNNQCNKNGGAQAALGNGPE